VSDDGDTDPDDVGADPVFFLAAANYRAFEEVVDKHAARNSVDRTTLRNALAEWVDEDLDSISERYDTLPKPILFGARDRCKRAFAKQFADIADSKELYQNQ
jgi:hypothetical protein